MLQCHPHSNEYVDTSKQFPRCFYFTGLQRKEGVSGQEGQQFDICGTVDEFRQEISMHLYWKPGMDIYVSHVCMRQLSAFLFSDGYTRPRSLRHPSQHTGRTCEDVTRSQSGSEERQIKRKHDDDTGDENLDKPEKRASISSLRLESVSPESSSSRSGGTCYISNGQAVRLERLRTADVDRLSSGLLESEKRYVEITIQQVRATCGQTSLDIDNLPIVRNVESAEQMGEHANEPGRQKLVSPSEVPDSEMSITCKTGLNQEKTGDLVSANMDNAETGSSMRILNWKGGGVQID